MEAVSLQLGLVIVPVGMVVLHVLVLRGAARLLRLPRGRVFLCAGAPLARALLAGLAGPLFQLALAMLLLTAAFRITGEIGEGPMVVQEVARGAAAEGKLERDDLLLAVDGQPLTRDLTLPTLLQRGKGATATIRLRRAGAEVDASVTPRLEDGSYRIGVVLMQQMRPISTGRALGLASGRTFDLLGSLASAVVDRIRSTERPALAGPVGLVAAMRQPGRGPAVLLFGFAAMALVVGLILLLFDAAWIFIRSGSGRTSRQAATAER